MTFSTVLMIIGIICIIISFFLKDSSKKIEKELEELSLNVIQETSSLKRRVKLIEEELLLDSNLNFANSKTKQNKSNNSSSQKSKNAKPINKILVQQVIELNKQGYSISDIKKLSSLNEEQVLSIIRSNGGSR